MANGMCQAFWDNSEKNLGSICSNRHLLWPVDPDLSRQCRCNGLSLDEAFGMGGLGGEGNLVLSGRSRTPSARLCL